LADNSGATPDKNYNGVIVKTEYGPAATAVTSVPEPSSLALMSIGLLATAFAFRKKTSVA
jgi:hypothetical protein